MALRQEQLIFIAALGVVVAGLVGAGSRERASRTRGAASEVELPRFSAPAWPAESAAEGTGAPRSVSPQREVNELLTRALFSPPRDTRPLDPLSFEAPPLPPLRRLAPPGSSGPAPQALARYLGRPSLVQPAPDLFDGGGAEASAPAAALVSPFAGATSFADLDPTERQEAQSAFKGQYDWLRTEAELLFGQIVDGDRFGLILPSRAGDPVRFVQIDPFSGLQRFPGQPAIAYDRSRVVDFGFAETPSNQLETSFRSLPDALTPASYNAAIALAERALTLRLEVPRAPVIAENLYRRAIQAKPDDPTPQIGVAQTLEAARDYTGALAELELLCQRYPNSAATWIALGELQLRFLDFAAAEENLRKAVAVERGSSRAHFVLGRLLFDRERFAEASSAFAAAVTHAPAAIEAKAQRLEARLWQARVSLMQADLEAAGAEFASALAAEPESSFAQAGVLECARLLASQAGSAGASATPPTSAGAGGVATGLASVSAGTPGRDLALARGLLLLDQGQLVAARGELEIALQADPLQAAGGLAALSYLAEVAGLEAEALDFATQALIADPQDAWVLYHRGRLLRAREDFPGARAHLAAALARESNFEDALAELGELSLDSEDFASAALYFERAEELAERRFSPRPDLVARRGFARLFDQAYRDARAQFERALALEGATFEARAGLAWCEYRLGDVEEALIQLRGLDDARRELGDDDPLRRWSLAQIARIEDHRSKDVWSDRFEYTRMGNGWQVDEAAGPTAALQAGQLVFQGNFKQSGQVRFWREYAAAEFVAVEADIEIAASSTVRAGLFVAREISRPTGVQVQAQVALARARDGTTQVLALDSARGEEGWIDLSKSDFAFPIGRKVHVRIERVVSGKSETINILLDGVPVLVGREMGSLGRGSAPLKVGVFAEGETGRQLQLALDDVEVTRRIK